MKPYSVLLAYPWDTNGETFTYFEHVESTNPRCAVVAVQKLAASANDGNYEPEDFEPLLCIDGHHSNLIRKELP
jgi:hypothetical protein